MKIVYTPLLFFLVCIINCQLSFLSVRNFNLDGKQYVSKIQKKYKRNLHKLFTYHKYNNLYIYRNNINKSSYQVRKKIYKLERVPDHIQKIVKMNRGKVIFFNGILTQQMEMLHYNGVIPRGWKSNKYTYNNLRHVYSNEFQSILLGIKGPYFRDNDLSLHEYGHMFDSIVGEVIYNHSLSNTKQIAKLIKLYHHRLSDYEKIPSEFVASMFFRYYNSNKERANLKIKMPGIYYYFFALEVLTWENFQVNNEIILSLNQKRRIER